MNDARPSARRPKSTAWRYDGEDPGGDRYRRGRLLVISQLIDAVELPGSGGLTGPTWHVSVSRSGKHRSSDAELNVVRLAFNMQEGEEDNHHPGIARHLFMPVDPTYRNTCECKLTETVIVEPDGYEWTNPTDGPCRGCEIHRLTGSPCTIHTETTQETPCS